MFGKSSSVRKQNKNDPWVSKSGALTFGWLLQTMWRKKKEAIGLSNI